MTRLFASTFWLSASLALAAPAAAQHFPAASFETPTFVHNKGRTISPSGSPRGDTPHFVVTTIERMAQDAAITSQRRRDRGRVRGSCFLPIESRNTLPEPVATSVSAVEAVTAKPSEKGEAVARSVSSID